MTGKRIFIILGEREESALHKLQKQITPAYWITTCGVTSRRETQWSGRVAAAVRSDVCLPNSELYLKLGTIIPRMIT